jgi:hypothetical protein
VAGCTPGRASNFWSLSAGRSAATAPPHHCSWDARIRLRNVCEAIRWNSRPYGVELDIRNSAGAMEDLDLLRDPACEVQAALTTFGVAQPADADALYSLRRTEKFSATVLFAFFANNVLDPAIGNKPHHGDHHVNCDRYPGTNKRQQYRRSIKCRGNFAFKCDCVCPDVANDISRSEKSTAARSSNHTLCLRWALQQGNRATDGTFRRYHQVPVTPYL